MAMAVTTPRLSTWLFRNLDEVREITWVWMLEYNEERDHDGLGGLTPAEVLANARISTLEWSHLTGKLTRPSKLRPFRAERKP